ncbi:hypothetical protein AB0I46_45900 [Streptomyces spectabilis]|uniref:hypothetical protein n=1 Tax=Streptomyces spectabilis TaxID=68270 RepID=UPI0033FD0823
MAVKPCTLRLCFTKAASWIFSLSLAGRTATARVSQRSPDGRFKVTLAPCCAWTTPTI